MARNAPILVKPDSVMGWLRKGFRLFWTGKSRRRRTQRPAVPKDVRDLIRHMRLANPLWGAPPIHGELLKFGIPISQPTVAKYRVRHSKPKWLALAGGWKRTSTVSGDYPVERPRYTTSEGVNLMPLLILFTFLCGLLPLDASSQGELQECADQFIDGDVMNAPTIGDSLPSEPLGTNRHLCYRDDDANFYALEYWPEELAPRWAAYKLSPGNYGERGCATFTRKIANCYVQEATWAEFESCTSGSDPFHADHMLTGEKLGPQDFSNTSHDRGHIAPRQAFSWHVCGTYQTFSMANMSPQRALLNQRIWQKLEKQVLTWGVDHGPIYVVTGTVYRPFPTGHFEVFSPGGLKPGQVYTSGTTLLGVVEQNQANREANESGDILWPDRKVRPEKVNPKVADLRVPTGYFKVIYRRPQASEPAHAIAFMLPHSFENLNMAADFYSNVPQDKAFWLFVSTIHLVEKTSGIQFPGISASMKSMWGDDWFFARDTSRDVRSGCGRGTPKGILENSTKAERLAACTDLLR